MKRFKIHWPVLTWKKTGMLVSWVSPKLVLKRHRKGWLSHLSTRCYGLNGVYVATLEIWLLHFVFLRAAWGKRSAKRSPTPPYAVFVKPGNLVCPHCGHALDVRVDERAHYVCGRCNEVVIIGPAPGGPYCIKPRQAIPYDPSLPVAKNAGRTSATPPWRGQSEETD